MQSYSSEAYLRRYATLDLIGKKRSNVCKRLVDLTGYLIGAGQCRATIVVYGALNGELRNVGASFAG